MHLRITRTEEVIPEPPFDLVLWGGLTIAQAEQLALERSYPHIAAVRKRLPKRTPAFEKLPKRLIDLDPSYRALIRELGKR